MSLLVISEILGLFVNTLTANDKYFLLNRNLQEPIRTQLSKKQKLFVNFLQDFWRLHQVLNNLKIKMTLIADVFLKLQNVKSVVTKMSKNPCFRMPFDSNMLKCRKHCWNLHHSIFITFSNHFGRNCVRKCLS